MKLMIFLIFLLNLKFSAQQPVIYDAYPYGQDAYTGGKNKLYKDIHQALIEIKLIM